MRTPLPAIVYEDDEVVAFDKPSGLLTAPDRWDPQRVNLMALVHERLAPDWFNVHRLDRDASGVLLCAKGRERVREISRLFALGATEKHYLALTHDAPADAQGEIRLALEADPGRPGRMRVARRGGLPCETHYEVEQRWRGYARLRLRLVTGRTHQIRVHLAAAGCPVVADPFYGGAPLLLSRLKRGYKFKPGQPEKPLMGRLALHALRLILPRTDGGAPRVIEAPLPKDFRVAQKYLDRFAAAAPDAQAALAADAPGP
mgnify:CR=1 FL=1